MGAIIAAQLPSMAQGDLNVARAISFAQQLPSGVLLTGTPTVTEVTSTDLTISSVAVNSAAITINGASVSAGQAVQMVINGQLLATGRYRLKITAADDSGETRVRYGDFVVEA